MSTWRVGRKVGRTIYGQRGPEPSDSDPLIGVMDTRELALLAVEGHNERAEQARDASPSTRDVLRAFVDIEPDDLDGGFVASCPSLPGCMSQGETEDEALDNITDAILAYSAAAGSAGNTDRGEMA